MITSSIWPEKIQHTFQQEPVSMHNLDKMQWMEKFYVHPTEPTQNNKSWKFQFNWPNPSQNIFSQRQKARFEKTSFKLMATEIVKIKLCYLKIRISWKTKNRFLFYSKSHLNIYQNWSIQDKKNKTWQLDRNIVQTAVTNRTKQRML